MPVSKSLPKHEWNRATAAHLVSRTGFGPSPTQWEELTPLSPEEAVEVVLAPTAPPARETSPEWCTQASAKNRLPRGMTRKELRTLEEMERRNLQRDFGKENRTHLRELTGWWLERMMTSDTPFEEKLTLFWHNHFATSFQKVRHPTPMWLQNLMFRESGRGRWGDLLREVTADPAMLIYLDNHRNNRRKPNENYARELMELFTLGEGQYTEDDVLAAARAFTGWSLDADQWAFQFRKRQHDFGEKTFLGRTGALSGEEVLDILASTTRTAEYLATRLWTFFASDTPDETAIQDIAREFRAADGSIDVALRTLFLHRNFYQPSVIRGKIKSPVDLTVGFVRSLQPTKLPIDQIGRTCRDLGQTLFMPPSVKGWDGGAAWITASSLSLRYQRLERFLRRGRLLDMEYLLPDRTLTREHLRDNLLDRFYFSRLRPQDRDTLDALLATLPPPSEMTRRHLATAISHLVQQPQYQLC